HCALGRFAPARRFTGAGSRSNGWPAARSPVDSRRDRAARIQVSTGSVGGPATESRADSGPSRPSEEEAWEPVTAGGSALPRWTVRTNMLPFRGFRGLAAAAADCSPVAALVQ